MVYADIKWTPATHHKCAKPVRLEIKVLLLMGNRLGSPFGKLPKELLYCLCEWIAGSVVLVGWRHITAVNPADPARIHTSGDCGRTVEFPRRSCNEVRLQFDLGCHESPAGHLSTGISIGPIYLCFHPGFNWPNGAFRGPTATGTSDNLDMGWVPAQEQLHNWDVKLSKTGLSEVVVTQANGGPGRFEYSWPHCQSNEDLFNANNFTVATGGCPQVYSSTLTISFQ